jgi:hypothetical protein
MRAVGSRRPAAGEAGYLDTRLPPPLPPTLYARTGDWPVLLFGGLDWCGRATGPFQNAPLNPPARRVMLRDPTTASWRGDTRIMEHPHGTRQLPLHLRIRFGGASRQGLRPDFRRRSRRLHRRGTRGARRLRNLRHIRPRGDRGRGRPSRSGTAQELHGPDRPDRPRLHQGHRLRAGEVPLEHLPRAELPARAVRAYRAGRERRRQQGRGRGRPGHHVRLRRGRDARPDAGADPVCPRDPAPPGRGRGNRGRSRRSAPTRKAS